MRLFIPGNVPSSKNSRIFNIRTKILCDSKSTQKYKKLSEKYYSKYAKKFRNLCQDLSKPFQLNFYFIRNSKRKFDYINSLQVVQDLLVKYDWVDDDNCDELIPVISGYEIDKENPGVYISIVK